MKLPLAILLVTTTLAVGMEPTPGADTAQTLENFRKKYDLPALMAVVVKDGKICDRAAVGVRKIGDPTTVTTNDLVHIGSCTKAMTATLVGMFIDEGKLRWNTTLTEVFPKWKSQMDKQYQSVTVEQLLTHRGGVPNRPPADAMQRAWEAGGLSAELRPLFLAKYKRLRFYEQAHGTPLEQRREFVAAVLAQPPQAAPGTEWIYSNQGYSILGAILEKISGKPWEELITEKLFQPLHMDSAGFGPPGTPGLVDQPWGHRREGGKLQPFHYDNPPAIAPGGGVHCSLDDLARFTILHLQGETRGGLLKAETVRRLHTPPGGYNPAGDWVGYACGWICMNRDWAGGRVLNHGGSGGTIWKTVMWLAPEKNFSVVVSTNYDEPGDASRNTEDKCNEVANALIRKWLVN